MGSIDVEKYLVDYLSKKSLFKDKKALQSSYEPEIILHRDEELKNVANILAPCLRKEKPSNLFIYGKTGTGKTLVIKNVLNSILSVAKQNELLINYVYVNCKLRKVADTQYRLIAHIIRELGEEVPFTGLPTEEVYKKLYVLLNKLKSLVIIVLDEIDHLVKKSGDEIFYNLVRINPELKETELCLIGISNDLLFSENLDPRVKSSLSEEELIFPPYNAFQISDILKERAKLAFYENILERGVIEKCAAFAAREHGDARRALELLRIAGELAEREGSAQVKIRHLDEGKNKLEKDKIHELVMTQPKQYQIVLYSLLNLFYACKKQNVRKMVFTGEVYEEYKNKCKLVGLSILTQRRVSDILAELDMLGLINAKVISKGRHGRTREISLALPISSANEIKKFLEDSLAL